MKIAIAQTKQNTDLNENQIKGIALCREAAKNNSDLILFPEMFSTGYVFDENINSKALNVKSKFIKSFRDAAVSNQIAITVTFLEKRKTGLYNSAILIDRNGNDVIHYSKVHTCDFSSESILKSGKDFYTAELDTKEGIANIGIMICFDREFPESARVLMLKGAEIILVPNACEMEENRKSQLKSRAFENSVFITLANYAGDSCKGNSMTVSPFAFDENGVSCDTVIFEGENAEKIFYAEINLDHLREYRRREVWGNAYRKVSAYKKLTQKIIVPDFIRKK